MSIYFLMFAMPLLLAFNVHKKPGYDSVAWVFIILMFSFIIGFRYEVGADWFTYVKIFNSTYDKSLAEIIYNSDPGYYLLNWFVLNVIDGEVYHVNFACGIVTMIGVSVFSRTLSQPWLALLITVPYFLIVVSMGYTRQGVALGIFLLSLSCLLERKVLRFIFFILLAASFHKSAVLVSPLLGLLADKHKFRNTTIALLVTFLMWKLFLEDYTQGFIETYIDSDRYSSDGGAVRVFMNVVPSIVYLIYRSKMRYYNIYDLLCVFFSVASIVCIPFVFLYSTATDRVALYLMPLQMLVFSRIYLIFTDSYARLFSVCMVVIYYFLVLLAWMLLSNHSDLWVPYKLFLLH